MVHRALKRTGNLAKSATRQHDPLCPGCVGAGARRAGPAEMATPRSWATDRLRNATALARCWLH
eukprot:7479203-Lingulodinium_polyedra.AAC.1